MPRNFKREGRAPPPSRWGHEVVKLKLDYPRRKFSVHADLLAHFALDDFNFASETTLVSFITWMYQKSAVEEAGCDICEQQFVKSQHISDMVASWLFGSELGAADFQNDMMKVIFRRRAELWSEDVRKGWWSEVPVGSPLDEMFFNAICQTISRLSYTQEYLVQDAIDEFPEHVVAKFARRMAHKSVTGRWDPNDQGDGHEPDNLWAWLQVDDYMVEIEPQPDQGTIIQEGEDKAMNGESEVDKDDEVEDDDEDTMDEEMDDEEHDDRDPMDGLDDCDENADNNREIESESTASDSEDWPRYHDSIVDGL